MALENFNCTKFIIFLLVSFVNVECLNKVNLRANHPVYGISSILEETIKNSSACFRELSEFRDAVDNGKVWGLKMLDASGRPSSGFIYGNNLWLGSHTQCIDIQNQKPFEIRHDKVNHSKTPFDYPPYELGFSVIMLRHNSTMQFHMRLPLDWTVQIGICVPRSCSENELFNLADKYFLNNTLDFQKDYHVSLTVTEVRNLKEDFMWLLRLPKTIILMTITFTILLLTVLGTTIDVKAHNKQKILLRSHNNRLVRNGQNYKENGLSSVELVNSSHENSNERHMWIDVLKCFSVYSNVKRWTKTKTGPDSLPVIHGLRYLSMAWVVLVHTSFFQGDFVQNPPFAWRITENFAAQVVSNSTYCVDTFLFLSGFLMAYMFFKDSNPHNHNRETKNCFRECNKFVFICIHRFLRLTPTYAIAILVCDVIYTLYSKTSPLYYAEQPHILCDNYWWRNLLYINNLFPRKEMCLSWSWFLSADMQFSMFAAFLLILSTIYFHLSAFLIVLLILIQVTATAYKSYSIGYIPTLDDQLERLDALYDLPWNRMGPYLVGVVSAYILKVKLKNKLALRQRIRLILWTIFPLINVWLLFTLYTRKLSVEFSAFYMGISRTLWGVGIGWIIVATTTGNARLLEKFLSFKGFIPLSRLTYCAYLLNPLVVTMISLGSEAPLVISIPETAISACGTLLLTYLMSLPFSVLFESPFILLTKMAFKSSKKSNSSSQEDIQNGNQGDVGSTSSIGSTISTLGSSYKY